MNRLSYLSVPSFFHLWNKKLIEPASPGCGKIKWEWAWHTVTIPYVVTAIIIVVNDDVIVPMKDQWRQISFVPTNPPG